LNPDTYIRKKHVRKRKSPFWEGGLNYGFNGRLQEESCTLFRRNQHLHFLFAWNFFRGFDRGFHRNIWNHLDFVCLTFLLRNNSRVEQKYMQSMWIRSSISQKHLESLRFCLLNISSAEQFEGRIEIYGIMEIFFSRSFFCWSDRTFGRNIVWHQMRFRYNCEKWNHCWLE
jgi:hypothetical protein